MVNHKEPVKLKRGTASEIAARLGMSVHHVNEVIKRNREGSEELNREIEYEREREAEAIAHAAEVAAERKAQGSSRQKAAA